MLLETPPAKKSSAAVCSAGKGTEEGAWAKEAAGRNPDIFLSVP